MKNILMILMLFMSIGVFGQFPILDNFTSIGGTNQWYIAFGGPNMGIDGGTNLCYNIGGNNYANSTNYSFQSPNYTNRFLSCANITITFSTNFNIRNNDRFLFFYVNGGIWSLGIPISNGVNSITLPNTVTDFSIDLYTGNSSGGSRSGKYAHIDWFSISCNSSLPIELLYFNSSKISCAQNIISWATATETNNDHFEIEKSSDAINFKTIKEMPGAINSLETKKYVYVDYNPESGINYYRLKQVDLDGTYKYTTIVDVDNSCAKDLKVIKISNLLGQEVTEDFGGPKLIYYSDGSVIKRLF